MKKITMVSLGLLAASVLTMGSVAHGAVSYTGGTYGQNFDALPNSPEGVNIQTLVGKWADDTTPTTGVISIPGWYLRHSRANTTEGGTNTFQRFRISAGLNDDAGTGGGPGSGTGISGSFYGFGSTGSTDRALGELGSTTLANSSTGNYLYIALRLTNESGVELTDFTVTYTGEQWRDNGNANVDSMFFTYKIGATTVQETGYTAVAALDFASPQHSGGQAVLDGNAAANRATLTATISGISWSPGTDLWLRWNGTQIDGNDHGLAIDDLSFSAVPEPASLAALVLGSALWLRRRRG